MKQKLSSIFTFYKRFIIYSLVASMVLLPFYDGIILLVLTIKLLLVCFLWYFINETKAKHTFVFYKNLGVSPLLLFLVFYIIDLFLTLPILLILKEFTWFLKKQTRPYIITDHIYRHNRCFRPYLPDKKRQY